MTYSISSRRELIGFTARALAAGVLIHPSVLGASARADEVLRSPADSSFGAFDGAHAIGRAYLEHHPDEAHVDLLIEQLGLRQAWEGTTRANRFGATLDALRVRIGDDFRSGRTVLVRRWVLARSEARFCALLALTDSA